MYRIWTDHLPREDKPDFELEVKVSRKVLTRLNTILQHKMDNSLKALRSKPFFKNESYYHKLATELGYQRALEEIMELLKVDEND